MHWMILPFRRYADFSGRSRRTEYWMFMLFNILALVGVSLVASVGLIALGSGGEELGLAVSALLILYVLVVLIPALAVQVRRFHDQDKSGWFSLICLIPYLGALVVLVFMAMDGTAGPNRFGPDPKERSSAMPSPAQPIQPVPPAQAVRPGAKFCSSCGHQFASPVRFCEACGTPTASTLT